MKFKRFRVLLLPFGALLALFGCSSVDLLNFTIPRSGYTVHTDIAYGTNARQKLDIYVPDVAAKGNPVVVFFYGGRWQSGSKKDYRFVGQAFASKGYVTVIADYRLYPEVSYPLFIEDAAAAVTWTHTHIKDYTGNANNLFLAGHSSGAYLAVMLTVNDHYIIQAGGKLSWIKGTIGLAGPYDFLPFTDNDIIALFSPGKPDTITQPVTYVTGPRPPLLLLAGNADTTVLPRNTIRLSARLSEAGSPVTTKYYDNVAHIGIVLSLARGFRGKAPTLNDISDFISEHTQ
jgi:acetyl esterase/lipase